MADHLIIPKSTAAKGAQCELIASAWLIGLGYDVFRNMGFTGAVDLVAWRPGADPCLIDVKSQAESSLYSRPDGSLVFSGRTKHEGIHLLLVINAAVAGFYRPTGERYWPLNCTEPKLAFEPPNRRACDIPNLRKTSQAAVAKFRHEQRPIRCD